MEKLYERLRHTGDYQACLLPPQVVVGGGLYTPTIDMKHYAEVDLCVLIGATTSQINTLYIEVLESMEAAEDAGPAPTVSAQSFDPAKAADLIIVDEGEDPFAINKKVILHVDAHQMDRSNGFRYLQVLLDVGPGLDDEEWLLAVEAERAIADYNPVSQEHITQIVD